MNFSFKCHYHMNNNGEISASKPKTKYKSTNNTFIKNTKWVVIRLPIIFFLHFTTQNLSKFIFILNISTMLWSLLDLSQNLTPVTFFWPFLAKNMSTNCTIRILLGIYTFLSQHLYNHVYILINIFHIHWSRSFCWKDISKLLLPFLYSYKWCICSLSKHQEYLLEIGHDSMPTRVKPRHTLSLRCSQFNVKRIMHK